MFVSTVQLGHTSTASVFWRLALVSPSPPSVEALLLRETGASSRPPSIREKERREREMGGGGGGSSERI